LQVFRLGNEELCMVAAEEDGSALMELCLLVPLVLIAFMAATDLCFYIQRSLIVNDAASVGARYGTIAGNGNDTAGMQTAAMNTASGLNGFTATATAYCTCAPAGSQVSCTTTCGGQPTPAHYVKVVTNATVPVVFNLSTIPVSMQLSGTSIMRVSWPAQ
jgi:Flp pilus assembly protein TadG